MRNGVILFCLLLCLSSNYALFGQSDTKVVDHTINSAVYGKERKISVFLTDRYLSDQLDSVAVLYLLDGQGPQFFDVITGLVDYTDSRQRTIPVIVVGIHTENRWSEFSPLPRNPETRADFGDVGGKASLLQQHLREEVFPLIENSYRTSAYRILTGHSLAGSFVFHTLFGPATDMFDAYLAISPVVDIADEQMLEDMDSLFTAGHHFGKYLFTSCGATGYQESPYKADVMRVDSIIRSHQPSSLSWHYKIYEDLDHFSGVAPGFNLGFLTLSRLLVPEEKNLQKFLTSGAPIDQQIAQFQQKARDQLGYSVLPSAAYVRSIASRGREYGYIDECHRLYQWAHRQYPDNLLLQWDYAATLEDMQRKDQAHQQYQFVLQLLESRKETTDTEQYERRHELLLDRIARTQ